MFLLLNYIKCFLLQLLSDQNPYLFLISRGIRTYGTVSKSATAGAQGMATSMAVASASASSSSSSSGSASSSLDSLVFKSEAEQIRLKAELTAMREQLAAEHAAAKETEAKYAREAAARQKAELDAQRVHESLVKERETARRHLETAENVALALKAAETNLAASKSRESTLRYCGCYFEAHSSAFFALRFVGLFLALTTFSRRSSHYFVVSFVTFIVSH